MVSFEIPSDDSDLLEIENYKDEDDSPRRDTATSGRVLPSWAASSSSNAQGQNGLSRKAPTSKKASASSGRSSHVNSNKHTGRQMNRNSSGGIGTSNSRTTRDDLVGTSNSRWNSNASQSSGVGSVTTAIPGREHGESSSQVLKRKLPSSFEPSGNSSVENIGSSQIRETYGKSLQPEWHYTGRFSRGSDSDISGYGNMERRQLPPSLTDSFHHPGIGEETAAGADERLIYQAALQDLNQPKIEATLPDGLMSISLLRHQKIALAWMVQMETNSLHCVGGILADDQGLGKTISMIALMQMLRSSQDNYKSNDQCTNKPETLNLEDDDENSAAAPKEAKQTAESEGVNVISKAVSSRKGVKGKKPPAGTLVVCPASVVRQWARELDEKVTRRARLRVLVYHGGNRTRDPFELAKYDVVVTTYAIVMNELPKQPLGEEEDEQKNGEMHGLFSDFSSAKKQKRGPGYKKGRKGQTIIDPTDHCPDRGTLAKVAWFRVILDEAQTIKNYRTQVARACYSLKAKRRWCLSGTPIQNSIDELFSYFRFLRYEPYTDLSSFFLAIKVPISRDSVQGYKKLQAVLRAVMLRRTKGTLIDGRPIITLPPKTINLKRVNFSAQERAFYNKLESETRKQFKAYAAAGTVSLNYANLLLMLLRLRQACDHPLLAKGFISDSVGKVSSQMGKKLPNDMMQKLLKLLESSLAICEVCNDPPENAVATVCGHIFCFQCVADYLTGEDNMCPSPGCKEQLGADVVYSKITLKRCISSDTSSNVSCLSEVSGHLGVNNEYGSAKIRATLEIIQSYCTSQFSSSEKYNAVGSGGDDPCSSKHNQHSQIEGPIKAIVFSQWTSMLDLVERALDQSDIRYERLDGTMSLAARDRAVGEFNTNPEVIVMLMSLKAGNLGLNMVAACHVILLDLWWNPTTEDQAIDRAHRIGQTRPVTVWRLTIKDTVEDRILALQEEKRKMVASAFGEDPRGGSAARLTADDLKFLFNF